MSTKKQKILRWLILVLSIASVLTGVRKGECETVFTKAANVCLECIGIG